MAENLLINPTGSVDLSGYVPTTRELTINGVAYDLSADRSWTVSATPGGSSGQVQYNDAGAFGASPSHTVVSGASPETRLTETTNSEYTRIIKLGSASNYQEIRYNRVMVPGVAYAVSFDGTNDYINCGNLSFASSNKFTVSVWCYLRSYGFKGIVTQYKSANRKFIVTENNNGNVWFYVNAGSGSLFTSSAPLTLNAWHHIVCIFDSTTRTIYVDGVQLANDSYSTTLNDSTAVNLILGWDDNPGGTNPFDGMIDEVAIWNRALSGSEVTTLYNSGNGFYGDITLSPFSTGLVYGAHLQENTGTTTADYSGGGHTGILTNGPTWVTGKVASVGAVAEVQVYESKNGGNAGESGIHTWGNTLGRAVIEGVLHNYNIGGSTKATWSPSGFVIADTLRNTGATTLIASSASVVPLTIKGASSQSANLLELQNSAGTVLTSVGKGGDVGILTPPSTNSAVNLDVYSHFASGNFYIKANAGSFDSLDLRAFMGKSGSWIGSADDNFIFASYKQKLLFSTNNSTNIYMTIDSTEVIVNDGGLSTIDFRVEGDTNTHLLFADASADFVGIGTASPTAKLTVAGDIHPGTDNTYYLGKNDDDTPKAWKGIILKDQGTGTYYRLEISGGTILLTDLTD